MKASEITKPMMSVVRDEARRRARLSGLDPDDVEQEAVIVLLEENLEGAPMALVRECIRRRLIDRLVRPLHAEKRRAEMVSYDEIAQDIDGALDSEDALPSVDQHTIDCFKVESHEEHVVDRVAFRQVDDFIRVLNAPASRTSRHRIRKEFLPRIQQFVTRRAS